jgi:agmatinase
MTIGEADMPALRYRDQEVGFLGLSDDEAGPAEAARAVVIPFGVEASVCYGGGTARGPEAIIAASPQLEFFDEELWCEPFKRFGIATLDIPVIATGIEPALGQLERLVEAVLAEGKFPLTLGGEHALTAGAIRPFARRYPDLAVLQFDAHTDLRDGYLGEHYSHAAAMRRVLDHPGISLVSVGIRATDISEIPFIEANPERVRIHWAKDRRRWNLEDRRAAERPADLRHLRRGRLRRQPHARDRHTRPWRLLLRRSLRCSSRGSRGGAHRRRGYCRACAD